MINILYIVVNKALCSEYLQALFVTLPPCLAFFLFSTHHLLFTAFVLKAYSYFVKLQIALCSKDKIPNTGM